MTDILKGTTSFIDLVFIQDSSSTTGAGLTGLTSGSSGLVCYRARSDDGNAAATQITLSAGTRGTWSSGGFVEKDATNMPGWYEFGVPNAAIATGSRYCGIELKGATNMAPCCLKYNLVNYDSQDAANFGLSSLSTILADVNTGAGAIYNRLGAPSGASIAADIAAAPATLLDAGNGVEAGWTLRQALRVMFAALAGKADGLATTTVHYRDQADAKNRITATVDANGNRSAVTLDAS